MVRIVNGTNSLEIQQAIENAGRAHRSTATVNMSWRYGGVDVVSTLWVSTAVLYKIMAAKGLAGCSFATVKAVQNELKYSCIVNSLFYF